MADATEEAGATWAALLWSCLPWAAALLAVVLAHQWWNLRHFARRGLPCLPSLPFVGGMSGFLMGRISMPDFAMQIYKDGTTPPDAPAVGFFEFQRPILVVRDPALLRDICVKYFDHFRNHPPFPGLRSDDLFARSLFALRDQRWKDMRATMSPAYTASKMRLLFQLISECGRQSADYLEKKCKALPEESRGVFEVEFKDFFTRFATDVIATTAFGVHCDSLEQQNNDFYKMGKDITNFGGIKGILMLFTSIFPKLGEVLQMSFFGKEAEAFFRSLVHDTLTVRAERGVYRPDVLQLMMEARDGRLEPQTPDTEPRVKMTEEDITAQAVLFFFAGFESVSNLICFVCHLLAIHPHVQEKLQREVDDALEANEGRITYDVVQQLKYLDMIVNETLRIYPPVPSVDRHCASDVEVPLGDGRPSLAFRKGELLWVPIIGLHRDPRYWPDPDKFDPERFSDENKDSITPFTYLPFGIGPRMCLAQRFALLEAKVAVVHLVQRLSLTRVARTAEPMRLSRIGFNTTSENGFWCGVSMRADAGGAGVGETA